MNRKIKRVGVLGAGVMGSALACHFANIGCEVLLLDVLPRELTATEQAKGLTMESSAVRNRVVKSSFERCAQSSPSPVYSKKFLSRVALGNFADDMPRLRECDWIIEAVLENLAAKQALFEQVEVHRTPGTLVTSNTSGIPLRLMAEGRSEDFQKHFAGTHFFNPPRYLELLEVIPTAYTDPSVTAFLLHYGDLYLGKTTVLCLDTPAFIANRIGVWAMLKTIDAMFKYDLSIDDIDNLTGTVIGRPKSATFRTSDLVGLDTLARVADGLYRALPQDEGRAIFKLPDALRQMEANRWLGDKTGQGFYKKTKTNSGKSEIEILDLKTMSYRTKAKSSWPTLEAAKATDQLKSRFPILFSGQDKASDFYRDSFYALFQYAAHRIPEITDSLHRIDDAMRSGFGWELGIFETWQVLGIQQTIQAMEKCGYPPPAWVYEMQAAGKSFYATGGKKYYDTISKNYRATPLPEGFILLDNPSYGMVWKNAESQITDIGDSVLSFSWHSKSYTLGAAVIEGLLKAVDMAEKDYLGLIIGHNGADFSLGANLDIVLMLAAERKYDELDRSVHAFQQAMMRLRYSAIPVVVCPRGRTLGGGCEMSLHADRIQAAAETYMGLVEAGVGLIPAGGGTKELAKRASERRAENDVELNVLQQYLMNIATAKVALSTEEAREMGLLTPADRMSINKNRQFMDAKAAVIELSTQGYTMPSPARDILVQGRVGLGLFAAGIAGMQMGNYISEHDAKIAMKAAYVICGGDLTRPQQVTEQYLLDLEREAFVSLCGERKTLERIQAVLTGGKPLRN